MLGIPHALAPDFRSCRLVERAREGSSIVLIMRTLSLAAHAWAGHGLDAIFQAPQGAPRQIFRRFLRPPDLGQELKTSVRHRFAQPPLLQADGTAKRKRS